MEQSPTGNPLLPPKAVPFLIVLVLLAEGLAQVLPQHTIGAKIAHGVAALGTVLGLASPGLRRSLAQPPAAQPGIKGVVKVDEQ